MPRKSVIKTFFAYVVIAVASLICLLPCFFIACLPNSWRFDNSFYYWILDLYYKITTYSLLLPLTIKGKENIAKFPSIIIANHQSALDIPLVGSLVDGYPHIWLFLKKYAHYPILGFIARRMNVVVDHGGLRKLVDSIKEAANLIKEQKRHVILFPEGGRYTDNQIHKFFYGFAILAQETKRPVIPVFIDGIDKAYPPHSFWLYNYPLRVIIGEPFYFKHNESQEDFVVRVRQWFEKQLERTRNISL